MLFNGKDPNKLIIVLGVFVAAVFRLIPSINKIITVVQLLKFHQSSVDVIFNELKNSKNREEDNGSSLNHYFESYICLPKNITFFK